MKVVVMAYGSDVHDLDKCQNLYLKHCIASDYSKYIKNSTRRVNFNINRWIRHSSYVVAGCDWVDYLYYWDELMVSHFCISDEMFEKGKIQLDKSREKRNNKALKVLHAPNHKRIKGTRHVVEVVKSLQAEGYSVELTVLEGLSNSEIIDAILATDLVIDQLIIGWYAMFAIEAMSLGKPVICYLRQDLLELYKAEGLIDEMPIINAKPENLKKVLMDCIEDKVDLKDVGKKSREYCQQKHSYTSVGEKLSMICKSL